MLGATYRLLATDPGIRVVGPVTDPLGRKGSAAARPVVKGRAYEEWLVIDPAAGRFLAEQNVLVRPDRKRPGLKPGAVTSYHAVVSYGWTDTVPAYPVGKTG